MVPEHGKKGQKKSMCIAMHMLGMLSLGRYIEIDMRFLTRSIKSTHSIEPCVLLHIKGENSQP